MKKQKVIMSAISDRAFRDISQQGNIGFGTPLIAKRILSSKVNSVAEANFSPSDSPSTVFEKIVGKYAVTMEPRGVDYNIETRDDIDSSLAEEWVGQHEEKYQAALNVLIEKVERISFAEFQASLELAVESFNKKLDSSFTRDSTYVLVEKGKSNLWVAELAMKYLQLREIPKFVALGDKKAHQFLPLLDELHTFKDRESLQGRVTPMPRHIILFDDGSYSGKQMHDHVEAIINKCRDLNIKTKIYIIVPYITKCAKEIFEKRLSSKHGVFVAAHKGIPTIKEAMKDNKLSGLLDELYWEKEGCATRGVYYFDHKIPNGLSFVEALSTGNIDLAARKIKKASKNFQTIHLIDPTIQPPYK
jgi:hypothetical protein